MQNKIERLEYATSTHPLGPYQPAGVILDESPDGCWTVHQSIVKSKLASVTAGIHDLVVTHNDDNKVEWDWISFE